MSEENFVSLGNEARDVATLSELFDKAFETFNEINTADEPTNSSKIQSDIKRTMNMLEDATRLVSAVDMFSENETFEEVSTENVKYFLLPAFLGILATKLCYSDDRMHVLNVAEIYFVDFLKRVKAYGLTDIDIPEIKAEAENLETAEIEGADAMIRSYEEQITRMVNRRNASLRRYEERKELTQRMTALKANLSNPNIDDERKREYFETLIKYYVNLIIEELRLVGEEKPILEHRKQMGKIETMSGSPAVHKHRPPPRKLQPIIITRDEVQKKVYGAGYPSLPILTVQEFYEQRVKDGDWPGPSQQNQMNANSMQNMVNSSTDDNEQEDIKKEKLIEADDPQTLRQLRAMDEYKDTHRRGWGNRDNRS